MDEPVSILLVDDDPQVNAALSRALRRLAPSWHVDIANDAAQALTFLASHHVDVVVSDMRMPNMDGAELNREILMRYPWIIRVMLSGQINEQAIMRGTRWSERYLCKPCPPELLLAEITAALRRRAQDRIKPSSDSSMEMHPIVLVVDDSPGEIQLLQQAFTQVGSLLELYHVADGSLALEFLNRTGGFARVPVPHLILLDLNMPEMNGYEFLARFRNLSLPAIPVVVFSGSTKANEAGDAIRHGAAAYLPKPTSWDRFLELAANLSRFAVLSAQTPQQRVMAAD